MNAPLSIISHTNGFINLYSRSTLYYRTCSTCMRASTHAGGGLASTSPSRRDLADHISFCLDASRLTPHTKQTAKHGAAEEKAGLWERWE